MNFHIFPPNYARRRLNYRRVFLVVAVVIGLLLTVSPELRYMVRSFFDYPLHYKEYKQFGIRIPTGYSVHGIDVSRYQRRVDWGRVKKMKVNNVKISFAFIKATEGTWLKDAEYEQNWENAHRQGIIRGAYHYFYPDLSPKDQAMHFIRTVRLRSGDLPPVIDVEEVRGLGKAQVQRYTKEFLLILEKHYKTKPILYSNRDYYKNYFADVEDFKGYRFWIAHYDVSDLNMPGDENWQFWQHSDKGNVNGISERVDFNVFHGDSLQLRKLCIP